MAFRRGHRRKRKVVWLPNVGTNYDTGQNNGSQSRFIESTFGITLGAGNLPTFEAPLLLDNVPELEIGTTFATWQKQTLTEEQSFGYLLRRVVGKLIVAVTVPSGGNPAVLAPALWVTAGLIIRRVDETGVAVATGEQVSPQALSQVPDPWIWQRTWLLGTGGTAGPPSGGDANMTTLLGTLSSTNLSEASALTGTHMDAKTMRRVGPEERLFLDVGYREYGSAQPTNGNYSAFVGFDYRALGSIIVAAGNRRNASR